MTFRVFVSHSTTTADRPIIDRFARKLLSEGIEAYIASDHVGPPEDLASTIIDAIDNADLVIGVWTKGASESEWVNQELGRAYGRRPVILLVEEDVKVKGFFQNHKHVRFSRLNSEAGLDAVTRYLADQKREKEWQELNRKFEQQQEMEMLGTAIAVGIILILLVILATRK